MRPIEGILSTNTQKKFLIRLKKNGGEFSYRQVQGVKKKVYEANITLFNAFKYSDFDKSGIFGFERYMAAHTIMISFDGIPAIYFNSMFGNSNDNSKYIISGNKRDLNRYRWNKDKIEDHLKDQNSKQNKYYKNMSNILAIRRKQKAFHPNAIRKTLKLGANFFGIKRISTDNKQSIYCITNMTSKLQLLKVNKNIFYKRNLFNSKLTKKSGKIQFEPFQTVWLTN